MKSERGNDRPAARKLVVEPGTAQPEARALLAEIAGDG
jgi:hypothetical protein